MHRARRVDGGAQKGVSLRNHSVQNFPMGVCVSQQHEQSVSAFNCVQGKPCPDERHWTQLFTKVDDAMLGSGDHHFSKSAAAQPRARWISKTLKRAISTLAACSATYRWAGQDAALAADWLSCPKDAMESRIERLCIEHGLKMTGQRRVIARVLSAASDHPDVEELYRRASALDARISIATVYRTVRLLEEKNILDRRDFGGGRSRYETSEHGSHYHLIDIETGKVIEFEDAEHERLMAEVARRLGFSLVSLRLELFARKPPLDAENAAEVSRAERSKSAPAFSAINEDDHFPGDGPIRVQR